MVLTSTAEETDVYRYMTVSDLDIDDGTVTIYAGGSPYKIVTFYLRVYSAAAGTKYFAIIAGSSNWFRVDYDNTQGALQINKDLVDSPLFINKPLKVYCSNVAATGIANLNIAIKFEKWKSGITELQLDAGPGGSANYG